MISDDAIDLNSELGDDHTNMITLMHYHTKDDKEVYLLLSF